MTFYGNGITTGHGITAHITQRPWSDPPGLINVPIALDLLRRTQVSVWRSDQMVCSKVPYCDPSQNGDQTPSTMTTYKLIWDRT